MDEAFRCLYAADPFETNPLCQDPIANILPEFISDRSAYYQNHWFARIASDPSYRIPVFNAGTLTDPLFTPVENLRMSNRLQAAVPGYPIQQYFGDYQHFVQNKAKEWGDLCGADHHVCTFADYPGGDVNATPAGLYSDRGHHAAQPLRRPLRQAGRQPERAAAELRRDGGASDLPAERVRRVPGERARADLHGRQVLRARSAHAADRHRRHADDDQRRASRTRTRRRRTRSRTSFINGGRCPVHTAPAGPGVAVYDSEPLAERATMIGATRLTVDYTASTAQGVQLNARLYDVFPDGTQVMVDRGPYRVTERERHRSRSSCTATAGASSRATGSALEISQDDSPFLKTSEVPSTIAVNGVKLRIPVREQQPPVREDYKNASRFCKAERAFLGDEAFRQKYGANRNGANAHGKCVSQQLATARRTRKHPLVAA